MYRFGRGKWKLMLDSNKDIFKERTEVSILKVVDIYFLFELIVNDQIVFLRLIWMTSGEAWQGTGANESECGILQRYFLALFVVLVAWDCIDY